LEITAVVESGFPAVAVSGDEFCGLAAVANDVAAWQCLVGVEVDAAFAVAVVAAAAAFEELAAVEICVMQVRALHCFPLNQKYD